MWVDCQLTFQRSAVFLLCGAFQYSSVIVVTDTISVTFNASDASNPNYVFSESGIAWPGEAKKYSSAPGYDLSEIVPPPGWQARFPDGYTSDNVPNLHTDEHFQNWMRVAGLPTFTKLYGRNDQDTMKAGVYQLGVNMSASCFYK